MSPVKSKKSKVKPAKKVQKIKGKEKPIKKKIEAPEEETDTKEESADIESFPAKGKKGPIIAIEEHIEIEVPEEKADDEVLVKPEDIEDLLADELSLDDEDMNPFGDKWEE